MPALTIAKAAREAGVNIETVRFYERRGLIERPPKGEGYRVYSPDQVARIRFIKEAQQIGFSLAEIKELLALRADPNADCSAVQQQATAKQQEVRRKIEQLREIDAALETLIAACPGQGALQCCSIMEALTMRARNPAQAEEGRDKEIAHRRPA
jgi:MerR family mercuric resistance operon transcriptional regulator